MQRVLYGSPKWRFSARAPTPKTFISIDSSCIDIHRGVGGAMWRREIASEEGGRCGNHRVMTCRGCIFAINGQLFE